METQAVILPAERGSRLASLTREVPKALLPIGPRSTTDDTETSFLRRQVELLGSAGIEHVVTVVGCHGEQVVEELALWAPHVAVVVNPTVDMATSGSLHSLQFAVNAGLGILDATKHTLLLDADIVHHASILTRVLDTGDESVALACQRVALDEEEVLVYGTERLPRFLGKGLGGDLVGGAPCLGEATGIVKFSARDHALARATMDWMLGDPAAKEDSARHRGFGPARTATEHEQLTQHFMHLDRMTVTVFPDEVLFMEVDDAHEYRVLRETFYPQLLEMEGQAGVETAP